jgi:hypothetical protein
MAAKKKPSEKP